jgi:hypothetical protein
MGATGTFATAIGGLAQAYAQNQAGEAAKKLADRNADLDELRGLDAIGRGREAEKRHRIEVAKLKGSQRAAFAGQGVVVGRDSAATVEQETETLGELDALTIRNNAAREAWGYRVQASDTRARGRIARQEGRMQAVGTLLTTGANGALSYEKYKDRKRREKNGEG